MIRTTAIDQTTPSETLAPDWQERTIDAYLDAFLERTGRNAFFRDTPGGERLDIKHFWRFAEMIEVVQDALDRTSDPRYARIVRELCSGFNSIYTSDWTWNKYNDDIMWACIVFLRASEQLADPSLALCAKRNFLATWEHAYSPDLDGGLWWTRDAQSKNTCVNGPASIAATLLYLGDHGDDFKYKSKLAYDWMTRHMFDVDSGRVFDHINIQGELERKVWTYNLGTFIGAGTLLNLATGNRAYIDTARSAMRYAAEELSEGGILPAEYVDRNRDGDSTGFKGIFARWAGRYMKLTGDQSFHPWLMRNADAGWHRRNDRNLVWGRWEEDTIETPNSFESSSFVALSQALR